EALECVPFNSPSVDWIGQARQRVNDRIEIGRDVQAIHLEVVSGVADDEDLLGRVHSREAIEKAGCAYAAGQSNDHNPVIRIPECFTLWERLRAISNCTVF